MRGVALLLCACGILAVGLRPCQALIVGQEAAFGTALHNFTTNGSRIHTYFPNAANTDAAKELGVAVAKYGTVKQVTPQTFPFFSLAQAPGISQLMFIVKPCSQLAPHHHPRADELLMVIQGGPVHVGVVDEAAANSQSFLLTMNELEVTMIPIGEIHYIENKQCQDAVVVGTFSNADPGVELSLASLLQLPNPQLATALGLSQSATATLRSQLHATGPVARFQPIQDDGACIKACNITA